MISYELASAILERETRGPARLTVLYDEACPMCRQLRSWLVAQWVVVPLELLAAASPEARWRYPRLDHERTKAVLTVITQDGAVFEGERAWLMCAWALPRWRPRGATWDTSPVGIGTDGLPGSRTAIASTTAKVARTLGLVTGLPVRRFGRGVGPWTTTPTH